MSHNRGIVGGAGPASRRRPRSSGSLEGCAVIVQGIDHSTRSSMACPALRAEDAAFVGRHSSRLAQRASSRWLP